MYNICNKCGKSLENWEERKLILDSSKTVTTRCMSCYEDHLKIRA